MYINKNRVTSKETIKNKYRKKYQIVIDELTHFKIKSLAITNNKERNFKLATLLNSF